MTDTIVTIDDGSKKNNTTTATSSSTNNNNSGDAAAVVPSAATATATVQVATSSNTTTQIGIQAGTTKPTAAAAAVATTKKSKVIAEAGVELSQTIGSSCNATIPKDIEDVVTFAAWPFSCPAVEEQYCISVICGNTRTHWALHTNTSTSGGCDVFPTLIWKTIKVFPQDLSKAKLVDYIPKAVRDVIYGPDSTDDTTKAGLSSSLTSSNGGGAGAGGGTATAGTTNDQLSANLYTTNRSGTYRATNRIPGFSIYILSTNDDNLKGIAQLFRNCIPCRVLLLTAKDFVSATINTEKLEHLLQGTKTTNDDTTTKISSSASSTSSSTEGNKKDDSSTVAKAPPSQQGKPTTSTKNSSNVSPGYYTGMGVDRICGIHGAKYMYETNHLLVIDGGTAMTYTATNAQGKFHGGGISPGLRMKFRSLFDYTSALPYITFDILMKYIKKTESDTDTTTNTSIFAKNTQESIIRAVLSESSLNLVRIIKSWLAETTSASTIKDGSTTNVPTVVLTGGDIDIFQYLLKPYQNNELQNVKIVSNRSLLHHGIRALLVQQIQVKNHNNKVARQVLLQQQQAKSANAAGKGIPASATMTLNEVRELMVGQRVATIYNPAVINKSGSGQNQTTTTTTTTSTTTNSGFGDSVLTSIVIGASEIPKRATILFGTVVNSFSTLPKRTTVDKDFFSIFWDSDGSMDDIPPRALYERLILYTKANEAGRDPSGDDDRRAKLEIKSRDAKYAASVLAERSESVKGFVSVRMQTLAQENKKTPPSTAQGTSTNAASKTTTAAATAGSKRQRDESNTTTTSGATAAAGQTGAATAASSTNTVATKKRRSAYEMPLLKEIQDPNVDPKFFIHKRMAKNFDGTIYFGYVKKFFPAGENDEGVDFWSIEYDDGDAEDLERHELLPAFDIWYKHMKNDVVYHDKLKKINSEPKNS